MLSELDSLPARIHELVRAEGKRWQAGLFSPVERAALRELNAAAKERDRQERIRGMAEQAKALALQEQHAAMRHWQAGVDRRQCMMPAQAAIARDDARNIMEHHADELLELAADGAVRRIQRGHALTAGDLAALRAKFVQRRARRAEEDGRSRSRS